MTTPAVAASKAMESQGSTHRLLGVFRFVSQVMEWVPRPRRVWQINTVAYCRLSADKEQEQGGPVIPSAVCFALGSTFLLGAG